MAKGEVTPEIAGGQYQHMMSAGIGLHPHAIEGTLSLRKQQKIPTAVNCWVLRLWYMATIEGAGKSHGYGSAVYTTPQRYSQTMVRP